MSAAALVATLRARGVILEPRGDKLRIVPASAVTPDEVDALRRLKPEVLRLLADPDAPTTDIGSRLAAFRAQLAGWRAAGRPGWPLFVLPDASEPPRGVLACISCSAPIAPSAAGEVIARVRCTECVEAVRLAVEGEAAG